nr:hypothetical protein [Tanacetum cinerariifolium]
MDYLNAHAILYALVVNLTIYVSCIKQFWASATLKKVNDVVQLRPVIDEKKVVVTEEVIRQDLHLDHANGVECMPNEEIFMELALPRGLRGTSSVVPWHLLSSALLQEDASKQEGKIEAINADEDITLVDVETQVDMDAELQGRIVQDVSAAIKDILDEQIAKRLHDEEVKKLQPEKSRNKMIWKELKFYNNSMMTKRKTLTEMEYKKVQTLFKPDKDVDEPAKKRVAKETLLQESFKKLKAVEVLGFDSTQETPSHDPKEMSKEDVQNMLEIVLVYEFKVEALQVKYPLIDWEIHSEGSRSYWKIIKVGGIIEAYQSFEDMLKGFDKEDLVTLWSLVKEKFSSAVPDVDKEKALWVELKRLFEPDAEDVM